MYDYTRIKYLHNSEKESLFKVIDNDTSTHAIRNKAIFYTIFYAGLRASEVGMILKSDIVLENREIYCKRLKGSKNNTLRIIDNKVFNALLNYIKYLEKSSISSPYLFPSQKGFPISRKTLHSIMKQYCKLANIPTEKAHVHTLKHTRAIELAELGLDTKEIQFWLGHKSVRSTEFYFEFTSSQQNWLYKKLYNLQKNPHKEMY